MGHVEELFETRLREVDRATEALKPEFAGLQTLRELAQVSELTGRLVKRVLKLPQSGGLANHIPGIPIPVLLSSHNRLTVDLVPLFLDDFEGNYGLSPRAMIQFAQRKMIAVNIRDYDPAGDRQAQAARYEKHRPFLESLFAAAGGSVYFLARLRHDIFDNLPSRQADQPRLREVFEATAALAPAAEALSRLPPDSPELIEANFRGEPPSLASVRWHWAYTQCATGVVDSKALSDRQDLYDAVMAAHTDAARASAFLALAQYLRYLHLVHTAPLSASFGGTYNALHDGELAQMKKLRPDSFPHRHDWMYDELRDFLSDLHAGRMSRDILRVLPERHRQCVESFGIETCLRRDSGSGHEDYGDPIYVEALDEYVSLDDDGRRTMREVQGYLNDLAKKTPAEIARGIVDLAQMSDGVRRGRNARLEKLLKGHLTIEAHSAARVVRDALVSSDPLAGHVVVRMSGVAGRRYGGDFARRILKFLRIGKRGTA